jgi:prophage regulatory protein
MTYQTLCLTILRKPIVTSRTGFSRSTLHARINQGLFVTPISLGARAVGWPEHEVSQIIAAMIAGKSNDEIKELVINLIKMRSEFMEVA